MNPGPRHRPKSWRERDSRDRGGRPTPTGNRLPAGLGVERLHHVAAVIHAPRVAHAVHLPAAAPVMRQRQIDPRLRILLAGRVMGDAHGQAVIAHIVRQLLLARIAPDPLRVHLVADDEAARAAIALIGPGVALRHKLDEGAIVIDALLGSHVKRADEALPVIVGMEQHVMHLGMNLDIVPLHAVEQNEVDHNAVIGERLQLLIKAAQVRCVKVVVASVHSIGDRRVIGGRAGDIGQIQIERRVAHAQRQRVRHVPHLQALNR